MVDDLRHLVDGVTVRTTTSDEEREIVVGEPVGTIPPVVVRPSYSLDLCVGFSKVGEASAFEFQGIVRNLAAGEWRLLAAVETLDLDPALIRSVDSVTLIDESGEIVFAGIMRTAGGVEPYRKTEVSADGVWIEMVGVDLFGLLGIRRAWPTPSQPPPWPDGHDERTEIGSVVARGYIEDNIGVYAIEGRQVDAISVVDPRVGDVATWSNRGQFLDEVVGRICREAGIVCRARMTTDRQIEYVFASADDLSNAVLLTDQGDLAELSHLFSPPKATYVIAAGQGELEARAFKTAGTDAAGLDRVETIYESRNTTSASGLQKAASAELALGAEDVAVDVTLSPLVAQQVRYPRDYNVGDWLGVEIENERDTAQVEAVTFEITSEAQRVTPVLGRRTANGAVQILRDIDDLESRFGRSIE